MTASNIRLDMAAEELEFRAHRVISDGIRDMLSDIETQVTGERQARVHWIMVNDPQLYLTANPNGVPSETLVEISSRTWEAFHSALVAIESGQTLESLDLGKRQTEALHKIIRQVGNDLQSLTVDIPGMEPIQFDQPASHGRQPDLRYEEIGSHDGVVDLLSLRPPRPYFALRENNTQRIIKVFFDDSLLDEARNAAGRLIEVTGLTRYRGDGIPTSMTEVSTIYIYEDREVDVSRLAGALPEMLGTLSFDDYLDDIRGADEG